MHPSITFAAVLSLTCALAGGAGCNNGNGKSNGSGLDGGGDNGNLSDASARGLAVNFAVGDCPTTSDAGLTPGCCSGPAPLTLTFLPLTAGVVDRYLWHFGDGTSSNLASPTHTYDKPNRYDVAFVAGGPAGMLSEAKPGCVEVTTNPVGAACDVNAQCNPGSTCVCGEDRCAPRFVRGVCGIDCRNTDCQAPSVCADLGLGEAPSLQQPWRSSWCLASCQEDNDCGAGLRCRSLPSRYPPGGWVRACFGGFPLPPGSPCLDAGGRKLPGDCVGGLCANRGALGQCSSSCAGRTCPEGSACAAFANGEMICTPVCSPRVRCVEDPLLSCQPTGGSGPLAFTVQGDVVNTTYCVPTPCDNDAECPGAKCVRGTTGAGRCQVPGR